ncbi:MAG: PhoU domain-containing protein [Desulfurococcaceae archaeon]|jgi:phosphate uptake regulator
MYSVERRRVQKTGSSSFIITLPKDWIDATGLKSGDFVIVEKLGNKLVIVPSTAEPTQLKATLKVHSGVDKMQLLRVLLATYISGYSIISLVFERSTPNLASLISEIKNLARLKLAGMEVIEESTSSITFKVLLNLQELPLINAIRRLHLIVSSMLNDTLHLISNGDLSIAQMIIQRDDEADRFHHLIVRELSVALLDIKVQHELGISNVTEVLSYRIIARNLERIADHAVNIAKRVVAVGGLSHPEYVYNYLRGDIEVFEKAMSALYSLNRKEAEEVIAKVKNIVTEIEEVIYGKVLEAPLEPKEKITVAMILDSIKRIARYSNGIAEAVLNIKASKMPELEVK